MPGMPGGLLQQVQQDPAQCEPPAVAEWLHRELVQAVRLDQLSVRPLRDGRPFSLRWVRLPLLEETARHAGHADLLREAIDGTVGE